MIKCYTCMSFLLTANRKMLLICNGQACLTLIEISFSLLYIVAAYIRPLFASGGLDSSISSNYRFILLKWTLLHCKKKERIYTGLGKGLWGHRHGWEGGENGAIVCNVSVVPAMPGRLIKIPQ